MAGAAARTDVPTLMELVGRVDSPLLRLARDFDAAFETRLQFMPLSQLWLLLQVGQLTEEESFAAVFLLNQRYSQHAVKARPFTPHLLAMASCSATSTLLRQFIAEVLRGGGQVMETSPTQLRAAKEAAALAQREPMASGLELDTLLQEFGEGREEVERIFGCLPATAVPSAALHTAAAGSSKQREAEEAVEASLRAMRARRPQRDTPCRAGGSSSSSAAVQPAAGLRGGGGNGKTALPEEACLQLRGLLEEAQAKPLTPAASQQLLQAVQGGPSMLRQLRLQPAAIPALVRHNAEVAREVLGTVVGGPEESDWLEVLASMDMSLNSMEVVNELCASRQLPSEFVESYISNCVGRCHAVHDRYMQSRLVRLLCMFLQILIRDRLITIQGAVRHQVEALCVQFGHIKEAAGLFRHLKSLSLQGGGDSAPAAGPPTDGDAPPALASTSSAAASEAAASAAPQQPPPAADRVEAA